MHSPLTATPWHAPADAARPDAVGDTVNADLAACHSLLAQGSRTFLAASRILPRAVRQPACALYAFCRMADDAVDGQADPGAAVLQLQQRLADIYAGRPARQVEDRALAAVVHSFAIPPALPQALIEGFAWDASARRYDTLQQVHDYAARVAGAVGAMMALLMGVRSPSALARACDLGVAMQLSNIARDVGEDARMGRLYLPRDWLREAGIDADAWLARPHFSPALGAVVARLLQEAEQLYQRAALGVAELPRGCRPGINAARLLYREIGREVQRRGMDSVQRRAVVSPARKALGLARAVWSLPPDPAASTTLPALPATAYLVDAVQQWHAPPVLGWAVHQAPPWWRLDVRWSRTLELFEQLERRDRQLWAKPSA